MRRRKTRMHGNMARLRGVTRDACKDACVRASRFKLGMR